MMLSKLINQLVTQLKSMANKDLLEKVIRELLCHCNKRLQNLEDQGLTSSKQITERRIWSLKAIEGIMFPPSSILDSRVLEFIKEYLHNQQNTIGRKDPVTINLFGAFYSVSVVSACHKELQRLFNMLSFFAKEKPELMLSDVAMEVEEDADESAKSVAYLSEETLLPRKDGDLYILIDQGVSRLNIDKLCDASKFEVVFSNNQLPIGIQCISVGSNYYMVGGEFPVATYGETGGCYVEYLANFDVFPFYPNGGLSLDPDRDIIPRLAGPKIDPIVVTLDKKVYALTTKPYYGPMDESAPSFEVFDPGCHRWRGLPVPPFYGGNGHYQTCKIVTHYSWGQNLVICLRGRSFVFDTSIDKWISEEQLYGSRKKLPVLDSVVEFEGFLIGMPCYAGKLVAYKRSPTDYPDYYQDLNGLENMFYRDLEVVWSFIVQCADVGRFCFIYSGFHIQNESWWICVAVFRLSGGVDSVPKITAVLESSKLFKHDFPYIHSAFIM